jgi:hypothetical protein
MREMDRVSIATRSGPHPHPFQLGNTLANINAGRYQRAQQLGTPPYQRVQPSSSSGSSATVGRGSNERERRKRALSIGTDDSMERAYDIYE